MKQVRYFNYFEFKELMNSRGVFLLNKKYFNVTLFKVLKIGKLKGEPTGPMSQPGLVGMRNASPLRQKRTQMV